MRKLVLNSVAIAGLAALLGGCGAASTHNLVKYENGEMPVPPTEAPADGTYGLYSTYDYNAKATYPLTKGDKLGFVKKGDKEVVAIAGSNEVPLQTQWGKSFYWRQEKMK